MSRLEFLRLRRRKGFTLLEVLVAVAIVTTGLLASSMWLAQTVHAVGLSTERERQWDSASAFVDHVVLWTRHDLEQRLGERHQGAWILKIERPSPQLFTISLSDTSSHRSVLIETAVFRRDEQAQ